MRLSIKLIPQKRSGWRVKKSSEEKESTWKGQKLREDFRIFKNSEVSATQNDSYQIRSETMTSLQSRLIYFAMMNRHFLQLRLKREAWDWDTSIPRFRELCENQNGRMARLPEGIEVKPLTIPGSGSVEDMYAEWLIPTQAAEDRVILYTIGGGYVSGSCKDHRAMVAKIALGSGVRVLLFEHRLAPEHPYPAALEDALAAYRWLLAQGYLPEQIMIVGESAGGGLCLATLLALRDQGDPLPAAAVALSPWTDLTLSGESHRTKARVCMSPPGMAEVCCKYYAGNYDRTLPWISPLYGDLHGLPPILIYAGEYETLLDDSTRFAEKAKAAGVDITLRVGEKMIHCYPLLAPLFPEATQALEEICAFIKSQLGKETEQAFSAEMELA
jgi:monoterpene epsilon-lactone hydrolase